jgi:hypothetical protein
MIISNDLKVTSEILWKGALFFGLIDLFFVSLIVKFIKPDKLFKMKWRLVIVMTIFFCVLFGAIASIFFWDTVYSYVFPLWFRWIIAPVYGLLFAIAGLLCWWIAFSIYGNPVLIFCLLGGLWGIITHILAIMRGILDKPPMLQGAGPASALTIAALEFIFYWCVCLTIARLTQLIFSKNSAH